MSFTHLLTRPVVIHNRSEGLGFDDYGDPVQPTETTYDALGYLEQTEATEVVVGQETYETQWLLVLDADRPLNAFDQVTVPDIGETFDVIGTPDRPWRPTTGEHHVEARLRLVTAGEEQP